jgi:hypothetical protein
MKNVLLWSGIQFNSIQFNSIQSNPLRLLMMVAILLSSNGMFGQGTTPCGVPFDVQVTDSKMSTLFPSGGAWAPGTVIYVTQRLEVNQNTTFAGLTFYMAPRARVVVTGSNVVLTTSGTTSNNTQFLGCEKRWNGITVQSGAGVNMSGNTVIRDAYQGLSFQSTAAEELVSLNNVRILNCVHGIFVFNRPANNTFVPSNFSLVTIREATGQGSAMLPAPGGNTQDTYGGTKPLYGIFLANAVADFATNVSGVNRIQGTRCGIYMGNSTLSIVRCIFESNIIEGAGGTVTNFDGTGIFAFNSRINVNGTCQFNFPAQSGIFSSRTRSLNVVNGNTFNSPGSYGIRVTQSQFAAPIRIDSNSFFLYNLSFISAIAVERAPGFSSGGSYIRRNVIFTGEKAQNLAIMDQKVCIDVVGLASATDPFQINSNRLFQLSFQKNISGIRVAGTGNLYQVGPANRLYWTVLTTPFGQNDPGPLTATDARGIIVTDLTGKNHLVNSNIVTSELNFTTGVGTSWLNAGFRLNNCTQSVLFCTNTVDSARTGFELLGNNPSSLLKQNNIGDANRGLWAVGGNNMPNQTRFENIWTGTYVDLGARHDLAAPPYKFFVDDQLSNNMPPTLFPTTGWFETQTGPSNASCFGNEPPVLTDRDIKWINGTLIVSGSPVIGNPTIVPNDARSWDERRILTGKLLANPTLTNSDVAAANFRNNQLNTSAGQVAQVERDFEVATNIPAALVTTMTTHQNRLNQLSDSLLLLDRLQDADSTTYDTAIGLVRKGVFARWANTSEQIDVIQAQAQTTINQNLQNVLSATQALPQATDYELRAKQLWFIDNFCGL